jgi:hypothetical protein
LMLEPSAAPLRPPALPRRSLCLLTACGRKRRSSWLCGAVWK